MNTMIPAFLITIAFAISLFIQSSLQPISLGWFVFFAAGCGVLMFTGQYKFDKSFSKEKISALLEGYEKHRELSSEEKKHLKTAIISAVATQMFLLYDLLVNAWPDREDFLTGYRDLFVPKMNILIAEK